MDKLKALTIPLGRWHRKQFGDLDMRINKFEEEIKKVDDLVNHGVYDGKIEARRKALVSSCKKWRSNRIEALRIQRRVVRNQARIKVAIRDFYKELYHQEPSPNIGIRDGLVRRITGEEAAELELMPSTEEIKAVGRRSSALIKLDFQKAYDRVKWSFVDIVLQKMGFRNRWRRWINECVCSASMSVLINGAPTKPFKMERGLRHGDPLSPFLFVLVVDVLHRMIGEAVRNGCILLLLVGRDNIELSHLQFADDTILFCPPEEETIKNYKRLLHCFELMSGLSINFEKSSLIPVNYEQRWTRKMCCLLDCKEAALPVRYLEISLGANPRLVKMWQPVIDKVEDKLGLWKAKTLNKAGKLVLIKSVLNSLSIYYLSLYKMPKAVAEKLISLQCRFLWSKEDGRVGMPLVRWEVVMAPKR
nr:uncharacterized protein LOC112775601 [Arachis hypogaea]